MTETERLTAIEAIRTLKARYFRTMDTKDWAQLGDVFTEDAQADFRGADMDPLSGRCAVPGATGEVLVGREQIVKGLRDGLSSLVTNHAGYMPEIEIQDAENATAIWAMSDILRFPEGPLAELRGWGHYHDTYVCKNGHWQVSRVRLTRLAVQFVDRA